MIPARRSLTAALAALCALVAASAAQASSEAVCGVANPGHAECLALVRTSSGHRFARSERTVRSAARVRHARSVSPDSTPGFPWGFDPTGLHTAYGLPTTASGTAPTIGVVDSFDDPSIEADLGVFDSTNGLPACTTANGCFTKLNETGVQGSYPTADSGWASEISLDVETVHGICQNCKIVLVEASSTSLADLGIAENTAVGAGATIVSNSFGGSESGFDSPSFNHSGDVIVASAGDDGYGTEYPASSPHVVAVGGTTLSVDGQGAYSAETVWDGDGATGSGCSTFFTAPSWQLSATGYAATGCAGRRSVADVSADADPQTGVAIYDSVVDQGVSGWQVFGGTSLAAPIVAGAYGLAGGGDGVAYPAATLYSHQADSPADLHDITSGSNGTCGGTTSCTAASGLDGPTGLGTPNGLTAFTATGGSSGGGGTSGGGSTPPVTPPPVTTTPVQTTPPVTPGSFPPPYITAPPTTVTTTKPVASKPKPKPKPKKHRMKTTKKKSKKHATKKKKPTASKSKKKATTSKRR